MTNKITIEGIEFELSDWAKWVAVDMDGEVWEYQLNPSAMLIDNAWMEFSFEGLMKHAGNIVTQENWRNMIYKV